MAWRFKRHGEEIEARDDNLIRAIILYRPKAASPWHVYRVQHTSGGRRLGGNDCFRTLADAKAFCANNPAVWGKPKLTDSAASNPLRREGQ